MRKVEVKRWKAKVDGVETDDDFINVLEVSIGGASPERMPRGYQAFKTFGKLKAAFEEAKKTGTLLIEEQEYIFLKNVLENDIPAILGTNPTIVEAVEEFLKAPEVKPEAK